MERDPPESALEDLEVKAVDVVGSDWLKRIDRSLVDNLGKYRKYDGSSVRDLLRVIRNKVCLLEALLCSDADPQRHHFLDLPENVRKNLGSPPDDFLSYFTQRFPLLFLHVWSTIKEHACDDSQFAPHFNASE
jgi:serine/threonine-protein kinase/endoribonuclease IRE1